MPHGSFIKLKRKTITCTPTAESTALVAGEAAYLLQAGSADVQDTAYISTGISHPAHQDMQRHSVTAVIACCISRCAVQMHQHQQKIIQLRCLHLQLGTLCLLLSSTVTLSLYLNLG